MPLTHRIALFLIALIPLAALFHLNAQNYLELQRSAMASPDEFSYLLMADNFLHDRGLNLAPTYAKDTFYPPGYPLLLAAWCKLTAAQITPVACHLLNALLLSICTLQTFYLTRHLLKILSPQSSVLIPFLVTALFATNWHVLETSLLIMSEPAFMLVTFAWLALQLKWPDWPSSLPKTLPITLLALAAGSLRSAGIICIVTTLLTASWSLLRNRPKKISAFSIQNSEFVSITLTLLLAAAYQLTLYHFSPQKSLAAPPDSGGNYIHQFTRVLTSGGELSFAHPHDWLAILKILANQIAAALSDYANAFIPPQREHLEALFHTTLAKILASLAIVGLFLRRRSIPRPLLLYILLTFALYLLWPYHPFPRFWIPILPFMLLFAALTAADFARNFTQKKSFAPLALLLILLTTAAIEIPIRLPAHAQRLNFVTDTLAQTAQFLETIAPDPQNAILANTGEHHFAWTWSLAQAKPGYLPASPAPGQSAEQLLLQSIAQLQSDPRKQLFLLSYFGEDESEGILANLQRTAPQIMAHCKIQKIYQRQDITCIWQITLKTALRNNFIAHDKKNIPRKSVNNFLESQKTPVFIAISPLIAFLRINRTP